MPKLEANLQFMFNEFPVLERYDMAAQFGFKGVEIQSPYEISLEDIVYRLNKNNLKSKWWDKPQHPSKSSRSWWRRRRWMARSGGSRT